MYTEQTNATLSDIVRKIAGIRQALAECMKLAEEEEEKKGSPGRETDLDQLAAEAKKLEAILRILEGKEDEPVASLVSEEARGYDLQGEEFAELSEPEIEQLRIQGDRAFFGYGGKRPDYAEAMRFYYDAAQCGSGRAYACLGKMYEFGLGAEKNTELAYEYYERGAELGDGISLFAIGKYHEKGLVPGSKGLEDAARCYEKAAEKGNYEATTKLGYMYENGIFYPADPAKALALYQTAADKGNPLGMNYLAASLYKKEDFAKAAELFKKSKELGCARAADNLGVCYEQGQGVQQSLDEAVRCYQFAAEKGNVDGMCNLGYLELKKGNVARDRNAHYTNAIRWLHSAVQADPKRDDAHYCLGVVFESGLGTDRDLRAALREYTAAAKLGHKLATAKCSALVISDSKGLSEEERKEAAEVLAEQYDKGDLQAGYALATTRAGEEREVMMRELAEKGSAEARSYLAAAQQKEEQQQKEEEENKAR